uniref:Ribosomal protein S13 n=1 Tax=Berkeleya fennica TaxID=1577906 RepID=A0A0U1Y1W8_BERFE|nr:ribosomal protein S13 [Berkeleya fennica]AJA05795.1 ribosomal protein S13 [Berkeleya fennica]
MIYLFESELVEDKSLFFALIQIYGVGKANSLLICKKLGFSKNLKTKNLSKEQINRLINLIDSLDLDLASELKKLKLLSAKKLLFIKSYKGLRKNQGLPIRGQRTHTNARTARKRR